MIARRDAIAVPTDEGPGYLEMRLREQRGNDG